MPFFKFKATDSNNEIKSGLVEAMSAEMAANIIKDREMTVISISEETRLGHDLELPFIGNIKLRDLVNFSRQFAILISANIVIVQALKIIVNQTENVKLKIALSEVADEVDNGYRLSDALGKRPKIFSEFYISVIRSGEDSGKLEESLNYLADELEKDYDMMNKIKTAMIYPAIVFGGLFVVGIVMMVYVVPKLTAIVQEAGGQLPLSTRMLIYTSEFLSSFWWLIFLLILGLIAVVKFYYGTKSGRKRLDYFFLLVPVFGALFQKIYLVRFSRSMHTLILGGVSMVNSLRVASDVVGNRYYQDLIRGTIVEVEEGNAISEIFSRDKMVPKMVSQMIGIGEQTGKLDIVLEKVATFYGREMDITVNNLMVVLEPVVMIIMGVAVGIMVAAIILPMYNLAGAM